jgi:hypothetical protein
MLGAAPLGVALGAGLGRTTAAQAHVPSPPESVIRASVELGAGGWKTWLLRSGDQLRLPPPPDGAAELGQVRVAAGRRDAAAIEQIAYWDAGAPGYRWNEIGMAQGVKRLAGIRNYRMLALLIFSGIIDPIR